MKKYFSNQEISVLEWPAVYYDSIITTHEMVIYVKLVRRVYRI